MGSQIVVQAGLKLLASSEPFASALQSAGITGVGHLASPDLLYKHRRAWFPCIPPYRLRPRHRSTQGGLQITLQKLEVPERVPSQGADVLHKKPEWLCPPSHTRHPRSPPDVSTPAPSHARHPRSPPDVSTPAPSHARHPRSPPDVSTPAPSHARHPRSPPDVSTPAPSHARHPGSPPDVSTPAPSHARHPGSPPDVSTPAPSHARHPGSPPDVSTPAPSHRDTQAALLTSALQHPATRDTHAALLTSALQHPATRDTQAAFLTKDQIANSGTYVNHGPCFVAQAGVQWCNPSSLEPRIPGLKSSSCLSPKIRFFMITTDITNLGTSYKIK
ncbi:hypothetical protein AAY473_015835, partial [Plecturocebus cupreus]